STPLSCKQIEKSRQVASGRQAPRRPLGTCLVEPPEAQIHAQVDKRMRSVRPESPGDRSPGVEPAAKPIIARLGLRLAHGGMPSHQIGTRVLCPAKINDFVVPQRVGVSGRAWEWSQDAAVDHGEAVLDREVEDLVVAFRRVFLEAEDE